MSTTVEIVWRNPHLVLPYVRRHSLENTGGRPLYIVQEFVEYLGYWMTISDLEVVAGGKGAQSAGQAVTKTRSKRTKIS